MNPTKFSFTDAYKLNSPSALAKASAIVCDSGFDEANTFTSTVTEDPSFETFARPKTLAPVAVFALYDAALDGSASTICARKKFPIALKEYFGFKEDTT
jgi:hypothetical protein